MNSQDISTDAANSEDAMPPQTSEEPRVVWDKIRPRYASSMLLWMVALFFILFIVWAALTELDRTVRGSGRIIPSSRMQVVSNLEGGIVDAILVNVGDQVDVGDPVVRLDRTQAGADFGSNRAQFEALSIKIARLQAEVNGSEPRFPSVTSQSAREQISIEQALYRSRMADLQSVTEAARARLNQSQRAVSEAQANYRAQSASAEAARLEVDTLRPLVERGLEPRFSLIQAQREADVASNQAQAAAATTARVQANVAEAQADLNRARQEWRAMAANELAAAQAERSALRRTLPALADRVRRTVVRAPLAGRVNRVMTSTVGGVVRPGDPIVEIVPSDESLIIEAAIRPSDIGQVFIGQEAEVSITAYRSNVYGTLDGEVVTISPDTTTSEQTDEPFYVVRIVTTGSLLDGEGNPLRVGPGMMADVSLLGDKQTVLDYILTPITRLGRSALRE